MSIGNIQKILETEIGFDPSRVSYTALESVILKRLQALNISDIKEYCQRVTENLSELQLLIENVVVPETWFFRHRKVFNKLVPEFDQLAQRYHTQGRVIRCLSLACSTGEEPYSLAIALIDKNLPVGAFIIDAVDISKHALEKAKHAHYGSSSFRADMVTPPNKHFSALGNKHVLREHVSRCVSFKCMNALDTRQLKSLGQYDIIFCRNMLIYFSANKQRDVLRQIVSNLTDSGILVVSPAEAPLVTQHLQLKQIDASTPMFFINTDASSRAHTIGADFKIPEPVKNEIPRAAHTRLHKERSDNAQNQVDIFTTKDLSHAWTLTDQGHLNEARVLCEKMLGKHFAVPESLYLLGVIEMTFNEYALADTHFRQHLVYQPNHLNALRYRQQALLEMDRIEEAEWCEARIRHLAMQKRAEAS